jgi:hypothetical protein
MSAKGDTSRTTPLRTCCLNGNCFACVARHVERQRLDRQRVRRVLISRIVAVSASVSVLVGWLATLVVLIELGPFAPPEAWVIVMMATVLAFLVSFIVAF